MDIGIYIHFPFCRKKCPYCNFASYAGLNLTTSEYIKGLLKEAYHYLNQDTIKGKGIDSVYLGGGSPSLLSPFLLEDVFNYIYGRLYTNYYVEVTIEINPATISKEKLKAYRSLGINRLSIGVQSFQDPFLRILGREHTADEAKYTYYLARKAGFGNIGIDLIFGLPDQKLSDWERDLKEVEKQKPDHISIYLLSIEKGTPFYKNKTIVPTDNSCVKMYNLAHDYLKACGYREYEISNFSKSGFESHHNLRYWNREDYLGLGSSAHSFLQEGFGKRWWNRTHPEEYLKLLNQGKIPVSGKETIDLEDAMKETVFLKLRLKKGLSRKDFYLKFSILIDDAFPGVVEKLVSAGLLKTEDDFIFLTSKGKILSNQVFLAFF
ncbi:MAG: radical SAM family heme chaperone HemW [Thermodesulfobacteriota bacterium]|nr:radical SAM family heme chaperone HemW [Thermodesulfobacteriota bacterium]